MIADVVGAPAAAVDRPVRSGCSAGLPRRPRRPPIVPAIPTRSAPREPWWSIRASIRASAPCNIAKTLPLEDHEVVLTFDDGPLPKNSNQILEILAAQCVKATFFLIGRQAQANPEGVRKVRDAGHTVATHSQNHPLGMNRMPVERARQEIDDGIASVTAALGDGDRCPRRSSAFPACARRRDRGVSRLQGHPDLERRFSGRRLAARLLRRASTISRCSGWRPREKAFCCCTTSRRARSRRCRESCMS